MDMPIIGFLPLRLSGVVFLGELNQRLYSHLKR
jgi:hypothetical protein